MIRLLFVILSFLPLCLHFSYLLQAWQSSRLDRWDWLFFTAAIPAAAWALNSLKAGKKDFFALFLLLPALFLTAGVSFHHINALAIAAAAGVIFASVWLCFSWNFAYALLPAVFVMLLGTPSSSYQLSLLLMCSVKMAWLVKFLLAVLGFIWIGCNKYFKVVIKRGTLCFSAALLVSGLLLLHTKELSYAGKSFIPAFSAHIGEFWGRSIEPDENTRRFFVSSKVRQFRYVKNNADISVLAVKCGRDIHEIHPASHCLRTGLWTVHSEKVLYLPDDFAVTEIEAQKGRNRILVWVWYSSEKLSTPGFLGFRKHFRPDRNHHTYQISVPLYKNAEAGREELKNFVQALRRKNKK